MSNTISWMAKMSTDAPRVPWDEFITDVFKWRQGQHIGLIGPTESGKTNLLINILPLHPYVAVMANKPRDETMDKLIASGYIKLERWQNLDPKYYPKRVVWPDAKRLNSASYQKAVFMDAFDKIYREGSWTVVVDEMRYFSEMLGMKKQIIMYLTQARSNGISFVAGSQRPSMIPLEVYDQSSHLFFWRDNDETNLKRISGISWKSSRLVRQIVSNLDMHQVLYVQTRTGQMVRTIAPKVA